ncbi:MAG TPA: response regulator transcription factor [Chloroflexota bacterium]|nr:response regulator transcription factor [Chloroflexota bacterium]
MLIYKEMGNEMPPRQRGQRGRPDGRPVRTALLVFSEPHTAGVLVGAFAFRGFESALAASGAEALATVQEARPALVVMDLAQPDVDGLVLCADLRARLGAHVPIIVCADPEQRRDSLLAFRLGADDFVSKPFDVDDVLARAEVALRRGVGEGVGDWEQRGPGVQHVAPAVPDSSTVGYVRLDHAHHRVTLAEREVRLSRSEFLLLAALMGRPDELLSRLDLARAVWGEQLAGVGRPIDQHMYRLRTKLQKAADAAGVAPPSIASVPGFGYRLVADERGRQLNAVA